MSKETPGTRRYFTSEEQGRALGDVYRVLLQNAGEGEPLEERGDRTRRVDELTPTEWRRVAAVIDYIRAQPKKQPTGEADRGAAGESAQEESES